MSEQFVIGIDPGTTKSAVIVVSKYGNIAEHFIMPNDDVIVMLRNMPSGRLTAIEMVENQGRQAVGKDTLALSLVNQPGAVGAGNGRKHFVEMLADMLCNRQSRRTPATGG